MMMQKVGNGHSLWNMLNSNLTIGLADKIKIVMRSIIYRPRLLSPGYVTSIDGLCSVNKIKQKHPLNYE